MPPSKNLSFAQHQRRLRLKRVAQAYMRPSPDAPAVTGFGLPNLIEGGYGMTPGRPAGRCSESATLVRPRFRASHAALLRGLHVLTVASVIALLYGCADKDKPAPVPKINLGAHAITTIRITVSDTHVDGVKVVSTWNIGNFKCAPIIYPEGYLKDQPVWTDEKVTKVGDKFEANILLDRFLHDGCNWFLAGTTVNFMRDNKVYVAYVFGRNEVSPLNIVCLPLSVGIGPCVLRGNLNSKEQQIKGKFEARVDFLP
jgi:hypothetical protein